MKECIEEDCHKKQYWGKYCEEHYKEEFAKNKVRFGEFMVR